MLRCVRPRVIEPSRVVIVQSRKSTTHRDYGSKALRKWTCRVSRIRVFSKASDVSQQLLRDFFRWSRSISIIQGTRWEASLVVHRLVSWVSSLDNCI